MIPSIRRSSLETLKKEPRIRGFAALGATLPRPTGPFFSRTSLVRLFGVRMVFDAEEAFLFEIRLSIRYDYKPR